MNDKTKRRLKLDDLLAVEYPASPALSRDGKKGAFVRWQADLNTGKMAPEIWKLNLDSMEAGPLFSDSYGRMLPRFSPDGETLYYLSDRESSPRVYQLWMLRQGTETRLTSLRHGISWFSLSEDGEKIAFEAPFWLEEGKGSAFTSLTGKEREKWEAARARKPIEITEVMYKFDETYGIPDGSISQLGYLTLSTGEVRLLTWEEPQHHFPTFSPDGERIACWRFPHDGWKKKRGDLTVYTLDGAFKTLTDGSAALTDNPPVWMDNEALLFGAYLINGEEFSPTFYKANVAGGEPEVCLPADADCYGPGALCIGHTAYGYPGELNQRGQGEVLFQAADKGSLGVYSLSDDGKVTALTAKGICIQGFAAAGQKLLLVKGTPSHIADLFLLDRETGAETQLTHLNRWMDEIQMPELTEMEVPSADGKVQIHGWVLKPAGYTEGEKYPAVLDIHGGPECFYPFDWWFELYYLSARGMAVVWCDPRGSVSYGKEYEAGAWDGTAYNDLMTFLDTAIQKGFIDENRLGVTGGSYGGYMTNYVIGHTHRFAAAVSQRNLCNRATSYGTGDMGSILEDPFKGCYQSLMGRMRGRSTTIKTIDFITTPLLILHATNDYRCSFEQGEQMFIAMKDRRPDVPVRFAAFPGENHGLTREGNVYAQTGHLREMADWFTQYLKAEEEE